MNKQLTKLPEYWYCRRNKENASVLNKWNNETYPGIENQAFYDNNIVSMVSNNVYTATDKIDKLKYYEISFEQFQQWVLNKQQIYELW